MTDNDRSHGGGDKLIAAVILAAAAAVAILTWLAVIGDFTTAPVAAVLGGCGALVAIFAAWLAFSGRLRVTRHGVAIILVLTAFTLLNGLLHHDLPRGRDDMGYIAAAAKVAESGSLSFTDIITRPYHPFRSIGGDEFTSQFFPGYNAYLGAWYLLGGLPWLYVGSALLFFLSILLLYGIGRLLKDGRTGLVLVMLYSTLYTTMWFARRTNSENLLLVVLLAAAWLFLKGLEQKRGVWFLWSFAVSAIALYVRGEGIGYVAVSLLVNAVAFAQCLPRKPRDIALSVVGLVAGGANIMLLAEYLGRYGSDYFDYALQNLNGALLYITERTAVLAGVVIVGILVSVAAFVSRRRGKRFPVRKTLVLAGTLAFAAIEIVFLLWTRNHDVVDWTYYKIQFVVDNFAYYLLLPYVAVALYGLYRGMYDRRMLGVMLFFLPSFGFLIQSAIAVDQPWFMRRFFGGVIPVLIIMASVALLSLAQRPDIRRRLVVLAVVMNLTISLPITLLVDDHGAKKAMDAFAQNYTSRDLILMEPGWQWQQWGYALHYLYGLDVLPNLDGFTTDDIARLIPQYDAVYVISSRTDIIYPLFANANLDRVGEWTFSYDQLTPTSWMNKYVTEHVQALSLDRIRREERGTPPRIVEPVEERLIVFRVTNPVIQQESAEATPTF